MQRALGNLADALHRDSGTLSDCEKVGRRFQKKMWTLADVLAVDVHFQIQSIGIQIDRVAQPSKVRRFVKQFGVVPEFDHPVEVALAQGSPNAPAQGFIVSNYGNLD